jgi:hypothetical protein
MLIYGIIRVIKESHFVRNLSCIFPEGNRYIDIELTWSSNKTPKVWKIKLDPEVPTKALFTTLEAFELKHLLLFVSWTRCKYFEQ